MREYKGPKIRELREQDIIAGVPRILDGAGPFTPRWDENILPPAQSTVWELRVCVSLLGLCSLWLAGFEFLAWCTADNGHNVLTSVSDENREIPHSVPVSLRGDAEQSQVISPVPLLHHLTHHTSKKTRGRLHPPWRSWMFAEAYQVRERAGQTRTYSPIEKITQP